MVWAEGVGPVEAHQAPPAPEPRAPGMAAWLVDCGDKSTFTTAAVDSAGCRPAARPSALCTARIFGKWDIHGTARQCPSTAHIPNHRFHADGAVKASVRT